MVIGTNMLTGSTIKWITNSGRSLLNGSFRNGCTTSIQNIVASQNSTGAKALHTAVSLQSGSNQSNRGAMDPEGFNVDNLDSDAKEKLLSLKNLIVKNSYYEKYRAKIMKVQQSCPMEFLAKLEGLTSTKTKSQVSDYVPKMSHTKKRDLDDVLKVNLLMELEKDDISFIWQEYHRKKNLLAACMPGVVFDKVVARTEMCPTFVLPLARKNGHDFHVVQYSNGSFYITPLVAWQAYKENSPVTMTVIHYDELKSDKGLVLMRGEFDKNSLTLQEAQNLAVQLHLYYAEADFARNLLMERFVAEPDAFTHEDLIKELERMSKDHPELFGKANAEN